MPNLLTSPKSSAKTTPTHAVNAIGQARTTHCGGALPSSGGSQSQAEMAMAPMGRSAASTAPIGTRPIATEVGGRRKIPCTLR